MKYEYNKYNMAISVLKFSPGKLLKTNRHVIFTSVVNFYNQEYQRLEAVAFVYPSIINKSIRYKFDFKVKLKYVSFRFCVLIVF